MSRPKTLILNDTEAFAGTEQYILALTIALDSLGEPVAVACAGHSPLAERLRSAGQTVVPVCPALPGIGALKEIVAKLRSGEVKILHANNGRTALFATFAITLSGKGRCVSTQHFLQPQYVTRTGVKAFLSKIAHRWVDHRIDHLIAISTATKEGAIKRGESTEADITVIPNGVPVPDAGSFKPVLSVRNEFGLAKDAPLLVCAARLEAEKDLTTLIGAMELIVRHFPAAVCVIAGEGQLRSALENEIHQKSLKRSVRLLGFRKDLQSIIHAGDLFILPSRAEPFGLVLIEAMSLGKAVVATAVGGPLEIVENGVTGLLVSPGHPAEMANAMLRILRSPHLRREMEVLGREKYLAEFTVERMAQSTIGVYRRISLNDQQSRASYPQPAGIRE